jgi:hypothetical protein
MLRYEVFCERNGSLDNISIRMPQSEKHSPAEKLLRNNLNLVVVQDLSDLILFLLLAQARM